MSGYCTGCGRSDMYGITHVCPPPAAIAVVPVDLGGTPVRWTCETCGMPQRLADHNANTVCPYGLVAAIEAGYISAAEACRRLERRP